MKPYETYSKESKEEIDKATEKWLEEHKELSTELYNNNNNESIAVSTSYFDNNDMTLALFNQPNRENRRKKEKAVNPHEYNIGRISTSSVDSTNQKQKKKQFNEYIKGKVK